MPGFAPSGTMILLPDIDVGHGLHLHISGRFISLNDSYVIFLSPIQEQ